jgi:hypothetical protein
VPPNLLRITSNWSYYRSSLIDTLSISVTGKDVLIPRLTSQDVIDNDIANHGTTISYYYCDFSDSKSLETISILGGLIRQLLEDIAIPDDLEQKIDQLYRLGKRAEADDELTSVLYALVKHFSKVYVCIDGLDECEKNAQVTILSIVNQLTRSDHTAVKVIVTSREESFISKSLREFPRLRISADKSSSDITAFIEETVKLNIRLGTLTIRDSSLESEITSALINGADGM